MRRYRGWLIFLAVVAVAAIAFAVFRSNRPAETAGSAPAAAAGRGRDAKPPVSVAEATTKDVPVYLDGLGTVQAFNAVTVRSRVDGELIDVDFQEGQDVKAGAVLAHVDPRTFQAQLDQAVAAKAKDDAQLAAAKLDLERYTNLGNRVSGQTLDTQRALVAQLNATVRVDQANVDNARTMLSYCTIVSPIDGLTGIRQIDKGNIIHASDTSGLVVIAQMQPISVVFSLPQQNLPAISAQMLAQGKLPVLASTADSKTALDKGQLELIDNQIDQTTGTIKLKATFPNPKRLLWPGGFVDVKLLLDTRKGATVVPAVAVQRGPQGAYVFALKPDSTVEIRPVKVAMVQDLDAVIDDGVAVGDKVVVDGMARLENGAAVTVQGARAAKPTADAGK